MKRESTALKTARAELLNAEWQRKAVYGISENQGPRMKIRRVYIPERELNGVRIPGSIQAVGVSEDP